LSPGFFLVYAFFLGAKYPVLYKTIAQELAGMLSEYGVISQVPMSRVTLMTTGGNGVYQTPYGTVEFTHTKRRPAELIQRTVTVKGRPLRVAIKQAAVADLMRSGRNISMIDMKELADA
jgi:hypothetical protein